MPIRAVEWSGAEAVGTGSPAAGSSAGPGRKQVGDRTATQAVHSLRLLPSGPDRVGEGPALRRPPSSLYHRPTSMGQASHRGRTRSCESLKPNVKISARLLYCSLTAVTFAYRVIDDEIPRPASGNRRIDNGVFPHARSYPVPQSSSRRGDL